jgi:glutamate synthase (NADPH/NADH) small chain
VDRAMIDYRVQLLTKRGVRFNMGINWNEALTLGELRRGFDALFVGLGRTMPTPLGIPGEQLSGVQQAYPFVLQHTSEIPLADPPVSVEGKRVLVVGGGETATDALRVALRRGAREAVCVYRRDEACLPANPRFYRDAMEEGAQFHFLVQPVAVLGNEAGNVTGVRLVRTELRGTDASGRGVPQAIPGSEFELQTDVVLIAYGYLPPALPSSGQFNNLHVDARGCLTVDDSHMTNIDGVFAAGAIVLGAVPLAEIVRDARNACASLDQYLAARRV